MPSICATLIICGVMFRPTLYRYDKLMGKLPVRMNRVIGYTEILECYKWKLSINDKDNRAVPNDEIAKIEIIPSPLSIATNSCNGRVP